MLEVMRDKVNQYKLLVGSGVVVLVVVAFLGWQALNRQAAPADFPNYHLTATQDQKASQEPTVKKASGDEIPANITVDVKGAVVKEGVYQLPLGSRVNDAIQQAGGLLEGADKKSVNLAQKLTDETVVYVATKEENISVLGAGTETGAERSGIRDGKVNLNTADATELQTIPGIGAKRAQDIIAHREAVGGFTSLDDLKEVSGIGDKTLERLREVVTLD